MGLSRLHGVSTSHRGRRGTSTAYSQHLNPLKPLSYPYRSSKRNKPDHAIPATSIPSYLPKRYNSTFPSLPFSTFSSANGQHSAGLVTWNRYSHFSGSEMCVISLAVPQLKSTLTDRSGPFQHFRLSRRVSFAQRRVGVRRTLGCKVVSSSTLPSLVEHQVRSTRHTSYMLISAHLHTKKPWTYPR